MLRWLLRTTDDDVRFYLAKTLLSEEVQSHFEVVLIDGRLQLPHLFERMRQDFQVDRFFGSVSQKRVARLVFQLARDLPDTQYDWAPEQLRIAETELH